MFESQMLSGKGEWRLSKSTQSFDEAIDDAQSNRDSLGMIVRIVNTLMDLVVWKS